MVSRCHNEDSLIGMHEFLAPGSVDVIVTSPPFNIAKNYSRYNDAIPRGQYLDWLEDWGQEAKRVLADDGSLFLNLGGTPKSPHGPHEVLNRLRRHFVLQNEIHIISSIVIDAATVHHRLGRNRDLVVGHHKPINSDRYLHKGHEYLYHFTARGTVPLDRLAIGTAYQDKSNVARWSGRRDRRCRGNVWVIPYPTIQNRDTDRPHPASFPVELPRRCIRLHGVSRTRLVLDPFAGIGTTALACRELGVGFVGFEIDYHRTAVRRLQQDDTGKQPALFDDE